MSSKLKERVAVLEERVAALEQQVPPTPEPLIELNVAKLDALQFSFVQKIIAHTGIEPIIHNDGDNPTKRGCFRLSYVFLTKDGERLERTLDGPELIVMLRIALQAVQKDHYSGS